MAKKVFDRIFKTIIMVIDICWGAIIALYSFGVMFCDTSAAENSVLSFIMSTVAIAVLNGLNILIRRWMRNY